MEVSHSVVLLLLEQLMLLKSSELRKGGVSNELFTEQRVKITKCFRVSDRLVPSGLYRLCSELSIGDLWC